MFDIVVLPLAKQDILKAAKWYNEKQKGLGLKFTKSIRLEMKFISNNPMAIVNRYQNIHTCVMKDFPYLIHFHRQDHQIVIVAVFHTSLNPAKWVSRNH